MAVEMGIYTITHLPTGHQYVGSTIDFKKRVSGHIYALRRKRNENPRLQRDWNTDGPEAFYFQLVEHVANVEELMAAEQRWMEKVTPYYNVYKAMCHRRELPVMGVYAITHTETGQRYIGISRDMARRFSQHKPALRQNKSKHGPLQRAWNTYGEDSFVFEVLEVVIDSTQLLAAEQRWIDATPQLLNRARLAGYARGFKRPPEECEVWRRAAQTRRRHVGPRKPGPRGEATGNAKLTEAAVRAIRTRHASGDASMSALAQLYGVTREAIGLVIARKNWKHVL